MPRIAEMCCAVLARVAAIATVTSCAFDANYAGGHFTCSDGVCPSGLRCVAGTCVGSTSGDGGLDASADGPTAALTCADPGAITASAISVLRTGSTLGRTSHVAGLCGGAIMNGPDAVFRVAVPAGTPLHVSIAGDYAVAAYVLAPCVIAPSTPACEGNAFAAPVAPITVTPLVTGDQFVIVDAIAPLAAGNYTLTVAVGP